IKESLNSIDEFLFMALRFSLASFLLSLIFVKKFTRSSKRTLKTGILLGLVLFTSYLIQILGLKNTTAINAGFISGIGYIIVPTTYNVLRRRRLTVFEL